LFLNEFAPEGIYSLRGFLVLTWGYEDSDRSRSPSGMTTREAKATANAKNAKGKTNAKNAKVKQTQR
jgi:hypothetical protein